MRNKTTLVLIEQIVMVLVFLVAATVCVRMFVLSEILSKRNEATDQAVLKTQNAAELLKSSGISGYVRETGATRTEEESWVVFYDSAWNPVTSETQGVYALNVDYTEDKKNGLWRAKIFVVSETEEALFEIPVTGQLEPEVAGNETI